MNHLDRIRKAHIAIMNHKEFCEFAGVLGCGKVEITTDVQAAATDGWNVSYNPEFMDAHLRDDKMLRFVVLHENMHKAYRHLHIWRHLSHIDHKLANTAADYFINTTLHFADPNGTFITMPAVGVPPDPKYKGWSVLQIFDDLRKDGDDQPEGFDEHDWEGADSLDAETQAQHETEIKRAIQQGQQIREKRCGEGSGKLSGVLGEAALPKVDWRAVLRDFVNEVTVGRDECTWGKINRKFLAQDMLMPGFISEAVDELVIGFDTSGSTWFSDDMNKFVAEITKIVEDVSMAKVHVVYWDTSVTGHQEFEDGQFAVQDMKPVGGGGTNGAVLFDYLRGKQITPSAIINFTDGYVGSWGNSNVPTLWAITSNIRAPWGVTLNIE